MSTSLKHSQRYISILINAQTLTKTTKRSLENGNNIHTVVKIYSYRIRKSHIYWLIPVLKHDNGICL